MKGQSKERKSGERRGGGENEWMFCVYDFLPKALENNKNN